MLKANPPKPPEKPEFLVTIHFLQNASCQGEISWLNTGQKVRFRSLLELINLVQEAVSASGEPQPEYSFRSWEGQKIASGFNHS